MSGTETLKQGTTKEQKINELSTEIRVMSSEIVATMREKGGIPEGLQMGREGVDFTVVSTGASKRARLILHASSFWFRESDGEALQMRRVVDAGNLDDMLTMYATVVSPSEIASVFRKWVSADVRKEMADQSVPINTRRRLYAEVAGPHVRDYMRQNSLPLLERLHGDVLRAHTKVVPQK